MFDLSIIVPTVDGREESLRRCLDSYAATTSISYEVIETQNRSTCGYGWVLGASQAQGKYIHFSADDLEAHPGWFEAAKYVTDLGMMPAPRIENSDGTLQTCGGSDAFHELPTGQPTDFSRIPFVTKDQWEKIEPRVSAFLKSAHYYTDNAISWAGAKEGILTVVHRGYEFTHHFAQAGRGAGMTEPERMSHDHAAFMQLVNS